LSDEDLLEKANREEDCDEEDCDEDDDEKGFEEARDPACENLRREGDEDEARGDERLVEGWAPCGEDEGEEARRGPLKRHLETR
jgi:hypothetical protein